MAKTFDPFGIFLVEEKKAVIEALGEYEITYRDLTMKESDDFSKRLVKGYGADGKTPELDFDEASKIKYEKIALILIDPKKTVEELEGMGAKAILAINEINALIEPELDDEDEPKGND